MAETEIVLVQVVHQLREPFQLFLQLLLLVEVVILEQEALEVEEHIMQVEGLVIHLLLLLLKVMMVVMV